MWATIRKPPAPDAAAREFRRIRRVTNAHSSEPVAPVRGRFAALAMWVEGLPADAGLTSLSVLVGGQAAPITYIGHPESDGLQQVNVLLPEKLATGLAGIELRSRDERLCETSFIRLVAPPPPVPRMVSLTDGINLVEDSCIATGTLKATVEEIAEPDRISIHVNGEPADEVEWFCTDPRVPTHEVNCVLPRSLRAGDATVRVVAGSRLLGERRITVAASGPDRQ
jgi:hypothetical protein